MTVTVRWTHRREEENGTGWLVGTAVAGEVKFGLSLKTQPEAELFTLFPLSTCCESRLIYSGAQSSHYVVCFKCHRRLDSWQGQPIAVRSLRRGDTLRPWDPRPIETWLALNKAHIFDATLLAHDLSLLPLSWPEPGELPVKHGADWTNPQEVLA